MKSLRCLWSQSYRRYSAANARVTKATQRSPPSTNPAEQLTDQHIAQVVAVVPQLRQYDTALWQRTHLALTDQGFTTSAVQRIISGQPSLLTWQTAAIQSTIECWRGATQFGDRRVVELLEQHPQLFELRDERLLGGRVALLKPYAATDKNIWRLLMNAPNLLTDREEVIAARIAYVGRQMRAELPDVVKSTVFAHSVQSIRTRHVFLDRLGVYRLRSLKVNPQLDATNRNPRMHAIYDSADREFATKVGGVSLEEWEVFQRLYGVELERAGGALADLDDGGDEDEREEEEEVKYD